MWMIIGVQFVTLAFSPRLPCCQLRGLCSVGLKLSRLFKYFHSVRELLRWLAMLLYGAVLLGSHGSLLVARRGTWFDELSLRSHGD